jgi:hypothetical protein
MRGIAVSVEPPLHAFKRGGDFGRDRQDAEEPGLEPPDLNRQGAEDAEFFGAYRSGLRSQDTNVLLASSASWRFVPFSGRRI